MHYRIILSVIVLFFSHSIFANAAMVSNTHDEEKSKQCENIANACINAGYTQQGDKGKTFWFDCMKPILMNKSVSGVKVDLNDIKVCRNAKIKALQEELKELKSIK